MDGFLTSWILHEKKFITYRLLSRERNCHVNEARSALQDFVDGHADLVKATYVIQGHRKSTTAVKSDACSMEVDDPSPGQKSQFCIVLVGQDNRDALLECFAPGASTQIYAVFPAANSSKSLTTTDLGLMSTVPLTLSSEPKYTKAWDAADRGAGLGLIHNTAVKEGDPRAVQAAQQQAAAQAKLEADRQKSVNGPPAKVKREASDDQQLPKAAAASKDSKKADTSSSGKTGGSALSWSKAKPKSATSTAAAKKPVPASPASEDEEASPTGSDVEMAEIGYADTDKEANAGTSNKATTRRADGVMNAASSVPTARSRKGPSGGKSVEEREEERRKLREMMDVEESNADEAGDGIPETIPTKEQTTTSTMKGSEETNKAKGDEESGDEPSAARQSTADAPTKRRKVRRKRRTVRKESGKDAKGYRYTREVSDYESYSDWTDSEEQKPATGNRSKARTSKSQAAESAETRGKKAVPSRSPSKEASPAVAPASDTTTPTAKATGAAKKAAGGGGATGAGQSKLSSFFKKK
ncbi:unnamed protein product [Parajaminaea phylloscopi]